MKAKDSPSISLPGTANRMHASSDHCKEFLDGTVKRLPCSRLLAQEENESGPCLLLRPGSCGKPTFCAHATLIFCSDHRPLLTGSLRGKARMLRIIKDLNFLLKLLQSELVVGTDMQQGAIHLYRASSYSETMERATINQFGKRSMNRIKSRFVHESKPVRRKTAYYNHRRLDLVKSHVFS